MEIKQLYTQLRIFQIVFKHVLSRFKHKSFSNKSTSAASMNAANNFVTLWFILSCSIKYKFYFGKKVNTLFKF